MQSIDLEILIATRNPGKIREIQEMLHELPVRLRLLDEFPDILPVEEIGLSYKENATLKALGYSRQTKLYALADDSGLEVEALGGMPGIFSARFGGEGLSDRDRSELLLAALLDRADAGRDAKFVCAMAFAGWRPNEPCAEDSEPQLLNLTEATCDGFITTQLQGVNGFGFDPVFTPLGYDKTFAELPGEVKSKISHRAKALASMRAFLAEWVLQLDRLSGHP